MDDLNIIYMSDEKRKLISSLMLDKDLLKMEYRSIINRIIQLKTEIFEKQEIINEFMFGNNDYFLCRNNF